MARPKLPEIEKIQNRVRKRYPGSICVRDSYGCYYIQWNEQNLNYRIIELRPICQIGGVSQRYPFNK